MPLRFPLLAILLALAFPAVAAADDAAVTGAVAAGDGVAGPADAQYRPGEVVVRYANAHASKVGDDAARTRVVKVPAGKSVADAITSLKAKPGVVSATPNMVAHASGFIPPDPGNGNVPSGWQNLQWNFLAGTGVNAPDAWAHLMAVGRPGGAGVKVAVLDTGIAYSDRKPFKRSPDFSRGRFIAGYDFVDRDPYPNDENGHGTHVAGTIAEGTGNAIGVTGLAYGVRLMPVRVLDRDGEGDSVAISSGIRWAADHGAKIINLSFEFGSGVTRQQIPDILSALRHARAKGALVVGASGNAAAATVAYPARSSDVLSVGATTQHGCQADYSNEGQDLDVVAPGGGPDAPLEGDPACHPSDPVGGDIYQMTFATETSFRRFGLPSGYIGTSMAAPHVTATAALVVASGLLGLDPTPGQIEHRLEQTAHDLGVPGRDPHYGWGLVDAAAATDPAIPVQ
jgi:serine protease